MTSPYFQRSDKANHPAPTPQPEQGWTAGGLITLLAIAALVANVIWVGYT